MTGEIRAAVLLLLSVYCPAQYTMPVLGTPAGGGGGGGIPASGLQVWYKADVGVTTGSACTGGNQVTAWADQSGNSNTLTPINAYPCYQAAQINALPAIKFDGSASSMVMTTNITLSANNTMFVVAKNAITGYKGTFVSGASGSFDYWTCYGGHENGADVSITSNLGNGTAACDTNWHQLNEVYTFGTSTVWRIDRAADGSGSGTGVGNATYSIGKNGGGEIMNGWIAEIIIYNRALSGSEVSSVESYLHTKYGL